MKKIDLNLKNTYGQWFLSFFITLLFFLIVIFTNDLIFATNDDSRILYALAGYATGSSYPEQPFINYFLGYLISTLYNFNSHIPWYGLYHIFALFISIVVIFKCFYKIAFQKDENIIKTIFIQIVLMIVVFLYPLVALQFTTTSAILGSSSIPVILTLNYSDSKKTYILSYIYCFVSLLFSFMTRSLSWYCVIVFFGLACLYKICQYYNIDKKNLKKPISIFLLGIVIVTTCFWFKIISVSIKNNSEITQSYNEYNEYRVKYMDYGEHDSYEENPQLYNQINWTENTYRATLCLLYFDEDINLDSLKYITDNYSIDKTEKVNNSVDLLENLITQNVYVQLTILITLVLFFNILIMSKSKLDKLFIIFCEFMTFILLIYLSIQGRLPLRSFMSLIIPNISFLLMFKQNMIAQINKKTLVKIMMFLFSIFIVFLSLESIYINKDYLSTQTSTQITQKEFDAFEKYAIEHPNNFYVYDFSAATINRDPFKIFADDQPINTMVSGGSYTYSELYYQQLKVNGLDSLFWKDLLKDNIYFVSANPEYVDVVKSNIEESIKKEVSVKEIKTIGNETSSLIVYKFS